MALRFSELNEDHQYALLQQAMPKIAQIIKDIDSIQDLIFSPGFSSPFPNMDDPIAAQALSDAQTAMEHLQNKLGYRQKELETLLLKANEIWHREKAPCC